jgi:teichuronic acid biosynthesis glycosyltransferase TuaC
LPLRLVTLSSLFPHSGEAGSGLFVRERMSRVGRRIPVTVVSPRPWFPGQEVIRRFQPGYRIPAASREVHGGLAAWYPRFTAPPGVLRRFDARAMARGIRPLLERLRREPGFDIIDAHFTFPDGVAAFHLARVLGIPYTITLRGTELGHSREPALLRQMTQAWRHAARVIGVSESLRRLAVQLGAPEERSLVVGNGVDADLFAPGDQVSARWRLDIAADAKVLITVGGLVERKGFHRVIAAMPALLQRHPRLHYLIVGGPSREGDLSDELRRQVNSLGLQERVSFLGPVRPEGLAAILAAADVFVLSTRNEGWANVILEAMACGLPVVATDVGGNREVVATASLGTIVPFDDHGALVAALDDALTRNWDRAMIRTYAEDNHWDRRVDQLVEMFKAVRREGAVPSRDA